MLEMMICAIDMVAQKRAAGAAVVVSGRQHEVVHNKLAAPVKQIAQAPGSSGRLERIILVHLHPRKIAPRGKESVPLSEKCLLLHQMSPMSVQPFLLRHDVRDCHTDLPPLCPPKDD